MIKPETIRELRTLSGLSQEECALSVYRTEHTWRKWESGGRTPDPAPVVLFCLTKLDPVEGNRMATRVKMEADDD